MHTKTISIGLDKGNKWTSTVRSPHKKAKSIPLIIVVRDILGYANNAREAKKIIREGKIHVDKKVVLDHKFGVGLMDTIEVADTKDHFVVLPNNKGIYLKNVKDHDTKRKLCRVIGKKVLDKGKLQYNFHDGSNIISDKKFKVNDTLVLDLPSRKIASSVDYAKGCQGLIVAGRHTGQTGTVEDIQEATTSRKSLTKVGNIQTLTEYVFAIGKDKPLIEV